MTLKRTTLHALLAVMLIALGIAAFRPRPWGGEPAPLVTPATAQNDTTDEDPPVMDVVDSESYAASLLQLANFHNIGNFDSDAMCSAVSQAGYLKRIVTTRRFAKLCAQFGDAPTSATRAILAIYKADLGKFERMRDEHARQGAARMFTGALYDPKLKDQSDLPTPLTTRILAAEMLISRFGIRESLPLVIRSYDLRRHNDMANVCASCFACDKLLTAPLPPTAPAALAVQNEYLALRRVAAGKPGPQTGFCFFRYVTMELPRYEPVRRPRPQVAPRPGFMPQHGAFIVELPPMGDPDPWGPMLQSTLTPDQMFDFARRALKAEGRNP